MKNKTKKLTPEQHADELMAEWFGPEYGAAIKKRK